VDGVIVATLTHTHHDIVIAAAETGKAVFCEKPIALTLAETDAMIAAIDRAGVLFQVGFMRRFDKGYLAAKNKIEAGEIGTPLVAHSISRDPDCPAADWADPAVSGGLILDLAIHDIDILLLPIMGRATMDRAEAVRTALVIQPRIAMPMHWRDVDPWPFKEQVEAQSDVQVRVLADGDGITP